MRKKLLAAVLAASMVFSLAPVLPVNTAMVASAEDAAADTETLTGTVWWTGNQVGKDYTLPESGSLVLYVGYIGEAAVPDKPAFSVELKDSVPRYFTTNTDIHGWCDANTGTEGTVDEGTGTNNLVLGHQYKITVTREGQDFTVEYYDVTADAAYNTVKATGTNLDNNVVVHVMAQIGTYMVSETQFEMPDVTPAEPTPTTPSDPVTPSEGTDFSAIETQPVVKYTFDNADGLELAGEAKVEEGVLQLATTGTTHETYAKIADLTSNDFANGITLTADIKVAGYTKDWTGVIMLGDGTLGSGTEGATLTYHLTQGFSSKDDLSDEVLACYGNGVAAPYTWDFFSKEENWNNWYTLAVTIASGKMTTYINGIAVQTKEGDYSGLLAKFSNAAKNNYLGTGYWDDPDFVGSVDNVGIYNAALSAEDMAALVGAEYTPGPDNPGPDNPTPDNPTPSKKTMKITKVTAKKNATKITGTVSVKAATVKVQVGKKAFKKATVSGKKFTIKVAKLKKGTKITVKATKSGYKAVTKTVTVK